MHFTQESGRTESMVKEHFCVSGGIPKKQHRACRLTKEQEEQLVAVCTVYSLMCEALTVQDLIDKVKNLFQVAISQKLCHQFLACNMEELSVQKTKHLASKRHDECMSNDMAEFIVQVEVVLEVYPMKMTNTIKYNKTIVFVAMEEAKRIVHTSLEHAQKAGHAGKAIGSLLSFVAANVSVFVSVWIFKPAKEDVKKNGDSLHQPSTFLNAQLKTLDLVHPKLEQRWVFQRDISSSQIA
jgi:hypothetical protein